MDFGDAIKAMKAGKKVARPLWAANKSYIWESNNELFWRSMDHPTQHYHAIHADIFAEDWQELAP